MAEGLTPELLLAAAWTAAACGLVAWRDLPAAWAASLAVARVGLVVGYFAWFYDGLWTTYDDVTYFTQGGDLLSQEYSPLGILLEPGGIERLMNVAESRHFLYTWVNLLAQYAFGPHYFSMVLVNVWLTFAGGYCFARLLAALGFSERYTRYALAFALVQWDVLVWSSFLNVKDPLVQALTMAALACLAEVFCRRRYAALLPLALLYPLFSSVRFYVPLLLGLATAAWSLLEWPDRRKWLLAPALALAVYLLVPWNSDLWERIDGELISLGAARFLLTPAPWQVQDAYGFLFWPSLAHWAMFLPMLAGAWLLWRESPPARLAWIYLAALVALYAAADELQGPRHRAQLAFLFAWAQFHVVWRLRQPALVEDDGAAHVERSYAPAWTPARSRVTSPAMVANSFRRSIGFDA